MESPTLQKLESYFPDERLRNFLFVRESQPELRLASMPFLLAGAGYCLIGKTQFIGAMRTGMPLALVAMSGIQYLRAIIIFEKKAMWGQATKMLEKEGVYFDEHQEWTQGDREQIITEVLRRRNDSERL